jgi:TPR repeat protein
VYGSSVIFRSTHNYGFLLRQGEGIPMDKSRAAHNFKLTTDQGYRIAQFHYGFLFMNGEGVPMDNSLAAHSFKLAVDQGHLDE